MADPFATTKPAGTTTAPQWVGRGALGQPHQKTGLEIERGVERGFLTSSWVYSSAEAVATMLDTLPWAVWEKTGANEWQVIDHPAADLVEHPNPMQTRKFLMHFWALHLLLGGNCLGKLVTLKRNSAFPYAEIWAMRLDNVEPIPDERAWLRAWRVTNRGRGGHEDLDPSIVIHGQKPNPDDPYWGVPPLRAIAKVVDLDVRSVDWNRTLIENDAAPPGAIVDPAIYDKVTRDQYRAAMRDQMSGPNRAREPMVLTGGAKYVPFGIPPKEMDWIESRKFSVGEICSAFGLLPARFLIDAATYNNLASAEKYEMLHAVLPLAGVIGDALGLRLFSEKERRHLRLRPDTTGVQALKDDVHKATESYVRLVSNLVPPHVAASILDLPIGEIEGGDDSWRSGSLERAAEPSDEDDDFTPEPAEEEAEEEA